MKKAIFIFSAFLVVLTTGIKAQVINPSGLGIRFNPDGAGITGKAFITPHLALEGQINGSGILANRPYDGTTDGPSFTLVGLLEYNIIFPDPSWRIYFGAGLHLGSWDKYDRRKYEEAPPTQGIFGVDGVVGVEYLFKRIPFGLSVDVKPAQNLTVENAYFPNNVFGFSVRYYFGHRTRVAVVEKRSDVE